jgi:hypothetical protein
MDDKTFRVHDRGARNTTSAMRPRGAAVVIASSCRGTMI